ncbi:hypothetical protein CGMCC3_g17827 [Colletotrichum fructicola]|nr:uncharacterized protein CGMCC3_g17827 [Colletotrichum fructicola]KAE9565995.1 hypothetical protein CGMCC3_g17827 [Colletotrichum fructicola]KAF4417373.1 hypothetical protein CFRS1_v015808 [Colletotrichum fructicola]KAF4881015.1 hypothetical protein CGCFRS4_v015980 [Colletotrichum fructicola]
MKWLILKNAANSVPYAIGRVLHSNPENDVNRGNRCFTISAVDVKYLEEAKLLDAVSLTVLKRHPTESYKLPPGAPQAPGSGYILYDFRKFSIDDIPLGFSYGTLLTAFSNEVKDWGLAVSASEGNGNSSTEHAMCWCVDELESGP